MVYWRARVELKDLWEGYENKTVPIHELAHEMASRLKETLPGAYETDCQFEGIVDEMANFHQDDDVDSFDCILKRLYDWADEGHRLWLATF